MRNLSQIKVPSFRRSSILEILDNYETAHITEPHRNIPLDLFMRYYFLERKKDFDNEARTQIFELTNTLMRYKGYLNAIASRK
jgi:16S rRNA (cytosine967-C5)-methyltransferase